MYLTDLKTRLKLTRWAEDFANECWQYGTNTVYLKELVPVHAARSFGINLFCHAPAI